MNAAERLTAARAAGVAMGSVYARKHFGWTTDAEAVEQLRTLEGVAIKAGYNRDGPCGWEVSFACDPD